MKWQIEIIYSVHVVNYYTTGFDFVLEPLMEKPSFHNAIHEQINTKQMIIVNIKKKLPMLLKEI